MTRKPKGRSLAEFQPLSPGEQKLLAACADGEMAVLGAERPTERTRDNTVRASFIRFLALGGDDEALVHEHGVQLLAAWIDGELDLSGARIRQPLLLYKAHFSEQIYLNSARASDDVLLAGSALPSLTADGAVISGVLFLDRGFKSTGEVRLIGAEIGGDLVCDGAQINGGNGNALSAERLKVKGSFSLDKGFQAKGPVSLLGMHVGGNFVCSGATFDGQGGCAILADGSVIGGAVFFDRGFRARGSIRLLGARIGGGLTCDGAWIDGLKEESLAAEHAEIKGTFFLRRLLQPIQKANFSGACISSLVDEVEAWGPGAVLDGLRYERLGGAAPNAQDRIAWLDKQRPTHSGRDGDGSDFRPQPWRHLQAVLREAGHLEDARQVAIAFEERLRHAGLVGRAPQSWNRLRRAVYWGACNTFHWLFGVLIGYGYRPLRLGLWMLLVWLLSAGVYHHAALQGVMGPSNPIVFQHQNYNEHCRQNWYLCKALPEEYTGFSPLMYSLDVLLPLVNLGQENDWAPLIPTPHGNAASEVFGHWTHKHLVRLVVWFEILFGWVASLLLVAVVSGLTKRRED